MRKSFFTVIIFIFLFPLFSTFVFADAYVLPYPSSMPGTFSYKAHLFYEKIMEHWYFGDFGQFDYNLKQSDKYLVEAKTLFEYKQYLLGLNALNKSNDYFKKIPYYLKQAKKKNKNIKQKENLLRNAALAHIDALYYVRTIIPKEFLWQPEKDKSTKLMLQNKIEGSIRIRNEVL